MTQFFLITEPQLQLCNTHKLVETIISFIVFVKAVKLRAFHILSQTHLLAHYNGSKSPSYQKSYKQMDKFP
jgi:hypothetical protein